MIARLMPSSVLRLLALLCLLASVLCAQPPAPPPQPATLRFLFLDETAGAYSLKIGEQFRQISGSPYTISPPYIPDALAPLDIYKTGTDRDPKTGEFPRTKVATFTPPANTTAALVILTPGAPAPGSAQPPPCSVEFIDSSPAAFPGGSIRILNRGRSSLAGQFAGQQLVVEPGTTKIITPTVDARGRLRIRIAVQNTPTWKMIDDNVAILKPDIRLTGVLVYSPSGMKFRLGPYILAERGDPPPSHVWLTYTDTP